MEFVIGTILLSVFMYSIYDVIKKERAYWKLYSIYKRRTEMEDRRMKLIAEKPKSVIFMSELNVDEITFRFVGSLKNFPKRPQNWDIANVNGIEYLYKDSRWYEIVDDISHLSNGL